jgi:predicted DNA-binding transcriptional regulator AlpA
MNAISQFENGSATASDVDDSNQVTDDEFITGPEVDNWLKISPSTRWRYTRDGRLPKPFRLHPHGPNLYQKRAIRARIKAAADR